MSEVFENALSDEMRAYMQIKATYDPARLDGIDASLAQSMTQINAISINVKYPPNNLSPVKGDGTTNDSTNIQNIVNYVASLGGGTLFFPKGTYLLNTAISISSDNIRIKGEGKNTIFYMPINTDIILFSVNNASNNVKNILFEDFTVQSNQTLFNYPEPSNNMYGIVFTKAESCMIKNVTCLNMAYPIKLSANATGKYFLIDHVHVDTCYTGIYVDVSNTIVRNCTGVNAGSTDDNGHGHFIYLGMDTSTPTIENIIVENCCFDTGYSAGIRAAAVKAVIRGNIIKNTRFGITTTPNNDLIISNNQIVNHSPVLPGQGAIVVSGSSAIVDGNSIINSNGRGIIVTGTAYNVSISNNKITGTGNSSGDSAIYCEQSSKVSISNNQIINTVNSAITQQYGIYIDTTMDNVQIRNNYLYRASFWRTININASNSIVENNVIVAPNNTDSTTDICIAILTNATNSKVIGNKISVTGGTKLFYVYNTSTDYYNNYFPSNQYFSYEQKNGTKTDKGTVAPASGTWSVGDKVENSNPTASGYMGWVCVTAGSPGTWKGYGAIQA